MGVLRNATVAVLLSASALSMQPAVAGAANSDTTDAASQEGNGFGIKQHFIQWMLTDKKFVEKAAESGHAEIELSKLALQKTQTPQIKNFAQKMVDDHSAAALELENIARSKNLSVTSELDADHQKALSRLQAAEGAKFDAMYIDLMEEDHEKAVSLLTAAAADKKIDPQLQSFAQKNLPTFRMHLEHAKTLGTGEAASAK
jgi:putative membrane protein